MPKKKLIHFQENLTFPHLVQPDYPTLLSGFPLRGRWNQDFFRNQNPIIAELGCGKGEYTVGLAARHPGTNFIGIDWKGARLWRGCKTVVEEGLTNVGFVRSMVDHIEYLFAPGEIAEIWITFPDPQRKKERKRLVAPLFLERYARLLSPGGMIHLKTDDLPLYEYALEVLAATGQTPAWHTSDLYASEYSGDAADIQTHYERIWLSMGKPICYIQFQINRS